MTLAARLEPFRGRPSLVAIATMNLITGFVALAVLAPLSFGADAAAYRRGALAVAAGGYDKDFLYTPLAALLATPLTWMPEFAAALLMTAIGIAALTIGVIVETRGLASIDRVLCFIAAIGFLPVVNELLLGQITLLFAAALWPIVRWPDRRRNGIAFGIAMALAPKPALLPVLLWMLLRRRQALIGVVIAGALTLGLGVLVMGVDAHQHWLAVLQRAGSVNRLGNVSLWTFGLTGGAILLSMPLLVSYIVSLWGSEDSGLIASLLAGLIFAPYTLVYSATILLLVVRNADRLMPWRTRLLALVANPLMIPLTLLWFMAAHIATGFATPPLIRIRRR
ncbi:MAG: glycosyltransferase family 87 protein [Chloroflexota bacterium]